MGPPTIGRMAFQADICIRGAGIVGQALALLLARQRWRVALVDSPLPPAGVADVRAYAINAASKHLLEGADAWPPSAAASPVQAMHIWGDRGAQLRFEAAAVGVPALHWMADVPALHAQLAHAVQAQPLVQRVSQPVAAALTVVSEGRDSQARQALGVALDSRSYGQHAVAARLVASQTHLATARQWFAFGPVPGMAQPQPEVLALLPLHGEQGTELALVWATHPARAQALCAMPQADFLHALHASAQGAVGRALGPLQLCSDRASWPLQWARAQRWVGAVAQQPDQSFALVGDAAHTVHPLAGQGLNMGLADAQALAQTLADKEYWRPLHDLRLLRRYERARRVPTALMGAATDQLQCLFGQGDQPLLPPWGWLRNQGLAACERLPPLKQALAQHAMGR